MTRILLLGESLARPFDPLLPMQQWPAFRSFVVCAVTVTLLIYVLAIIVAKIRLPRLFAKVVLILPVVLAFGCGTVCNWRYLAIYGQNAPPVVSLLARIALAVIVWSWAAVIVRAVVLVSRPGAAMEATAVTSAELGDTSIETFDLTRRESAGIKRI